MAPKRDIDRFYMDGIVTFCSFSLRGRDWMQREYPTKYNALSKTVLFRVPSQESDMDDFIDRAVKTGLIIRTLYE